MIKNQPEKGEDWEEEKVVVMLSTPNEIITNIIAGDKL